MFSSQNVNNNIVEGIYYPTLFLNTMKVIFGGYKCFCIYYNIFKSSYIFLKIHKIVILSLLNK